MTSDKRGSLYEKLYFTELDRRERISGRLALPFAVIVAAVGLLSYLFHAPAKPTAVPWSVVFWTLYSASAIALLIGAWFFRKAWFGHEDMLLPTAGHIEEYHRQLVDTYTGYENCDDLVDTYFKGFLINYYIECSSANAIINDRRSFHMYRATASLTAAVLLAFGAIVPFAVNHFGQGERYDQSTPGPASAATATTSAERQGEHAETTSAASTFDAIE